MKLSVLFLLIVALLTSGCVTVSDGSDRKIDKQKVLESHIRLGMAYLQQNQRDSALRSFDKALGMDKKSAEAHQGMAIIHQMNGEWEMAEKRFHQAMRGRADFSETDIVYTYALYLMERERYQEAFKYFENASKDITYRRRVKALFNLGLCSEKLGDLPRAEASFQYALNLDDNFAPAALELAHKSFERGDYAKSKQYLDVFARNSRQSARSLWLGIRIERIFENKDKEASYALALRNLHPYSREYLEYKKLKEEQ